MSHIPQSTKDNVSTFALGLFSNDGAGGEPSSMLLDGYKLESDGSYTLDAEGNKILCHSPAVLTSWLQWSANPVAAQKTLIDRATEYTKAEYIQLRDDSSSIWYINSEGIV